MLWTATHVPLWRLEWQLHEFYLDFSVNWCAMDVFIFLFCSSAVKAYRLIILVQKKYLPYELIKVAIYSFTYYIIEHIFLPNSQIFERYMKILKNHARWRCSFKFALETSCLQEWIENDHHSARLNENEYLLIKRVLRREEWYPVGLRELCAFHT